MATRGKLIAGLEGIDGSGKRTQLDLLTGALDARGLSTFASVFRATNRYREKLNDVPRLRVILFPAGRSMASGHFSRASLSPP